MKKIIAALIIVASTFARASAAQKPCDSWQCFEKKIADVNADLDHILKEQAKQKTLIKLYDKRNEKIADEIAKTQQRVKELESAANSARF